MTPSIVGRWAAGLVLLACAALAAPAQAQPLVVAVEPQVTAAPLIIAADRGWFAEEGLDVRLVQFHANRTMLMALAESDVDVALVDLTADAYSMAAQHNLRIIAGAEQLNGAFPRYAWLIGADLTGVDLDGLRDAPDAVIGLTELGSPARYLLAARLQAAVETGFVSEGSDVALAAALAQGSVDAALLPAHLAADLEATGAARVAEWAGPIDGPISLSVLMTTAAQASLRPEVLARFLRAYVRGVRAFRAAVAAEAEGAAEDADQADSIEAARNAALLTIVADGARRPVDEVRQAPPYFAPDGRVDSRSLAAQLAWWQQEGDCAMDIDMRTLLDLSALQSALLSLAADSAEQRRAAAAVVEAVSAAEPEDASAEDATDPSAAGGPQSED
ncbi:MAG: ABC transporter substrate-binding protein [Alphaproteobacteria bacterium]